ncbi:MAG: GGDEF domain-containing protein [Pseudomonadota bacterium]
MKNKQGTAPAKPPQDDSDDPQTELDVWSYAARNRIDRSNIEACLPLILSAAGGLGIAPFAAMRFMEGNWLAGIVDTLLIAGIALLGWLVYQTRQVRLASIAISVLCVCGVFATVYFSGPQQVYWAYPALMAIFYLSRPNEAILLSLGMIVGLVPAYVPSPDKVETGTVFITIVVMCAFGYAFSLVTRRQRGELIKLATKDPLTGAGNRRALERKLDEIVAKRARAPRKASLIMLDLDHFKAVNDAHGHATGDLILKNLTEIINLRIRITDSLFRIGGEEFVVVLDGEDKQHASHLAEQLRTLVQANELVPGQEVTISLGVAELVKDETRMQWLERADEAMYRAKRRGRNITSLAS